MMSLAATQTTEKTLAIFDDEEDILAVCSYIFNELGWKVHAFKDCDDILEKLEHIRPKVIFMDNWIPTDGGIVATQILKNSDHFRNVPVIYFSANADIALLAKCAGADAYLSKPFEIDDMTVMIEQVINV